MPSSGQQMLHMDGGWSYDSEEEAAAAGEPWPHTCQGSAPPDLGLLPGADLSAESRETCPACLNLALLHAPQTCT